MVIKIYLGGCLYKYSSSVLCSHLPGVTIASNLVNIQYIYCLLFAYTNLLCFLKMGAF